MNPVAEYTERTLDALCSCLIPETPQLADDLGEEHQPGARNTGLEKNLRSLFDNLNELNVGVLERYFSGKPTVPLSTAIALLLDITSIEYLLRRTPSEQPSLRLGDGPFRWLSPTDRRRVLDFTASESIISHLNDYIERHTSYGGFLKYLIRGITSVPLITYYSEWDGYDEPGGKRLPDPETFTGSVQSWDQTGFPGLKPGYSVFRGYEVEEFEENDY